VLNSASFHAEPMQPVVCCRALRHSLQDLKLALFGRSSVELGTVCRRHCVIFLSVAVVPQLVSCVVRGSVQWHSAIVSYMAQCCYGIMC